MNGVYDSEKSKNTRYVLALSHSTFITITLKQLASPETVWFDIFALDLAM